MLSCLVWGSPPPSLRWSDLLIHNHDDGDGDYGDGDVDDDGYVGEKVYKHINAQEYLREKR